MKIAEKTELKVWFSYSLNFWLVQSKLFFNRLIQNVKKLDGFKKNLIESPKEKYFENVN